MLERLKEFGAVVFVLLLFFGPAVIAGTMENHYTLKNTTVISVSNHYVTFEDKMGEWWEIEIEPSEKANYSIGQKANLVMFTNFTDTIFDDEIEKVKLK